ncbi:MAG: hypothetical protein Q9165_001367 [Trypethelium subeluteriae]
MLSKIAIAFCALLAFGSAFDIPEGQPDGLYSYHEDENGVGIHAPIEGQPTGSVTPPSAKFRTKRDALPNSLLTDIECDGGFVNPTDYANSVNGLVGLCNPSTTVKAGHNIYYKSGGAVAYMCNYGGDNSCVKAELDYAFQLLGRGPFVNEFNLIRGESSGCPNYQSGHVYVGDYGKTYGYMTATTGLCNGNPVDS